MNRIENANFRFDPKIATALDSWQELDQQREKLLVQLQAALAPTEAEQRVRHLLARRTAFASGIEVELVHRVQDQQMRKRDTARRLIDAGHVAHTRLPDIALHAPEPPPSSPDFWWVRTDWSHTTHFTSSMRSDGLVFTGGPNGQPQRNWLEETNLTQATIGAVAFFEISADRLPESPNGRWSSEPSLAVHGGLLASTSRGSFPGGDSWSKCWLHLDHKIFQWEGGPCGTTPLVLGAAHNVDHLLNETDDGRTLHSPLPGQTSVPGITFGGPDRTRSLWTRIEVRFEIHVEGAGAFLWCHPDVHLTTQQWPIQVDP